MARGTVVELLKEQLQTVKKLAAELERGVRENGDLHALAEAADELSSLADDLAGRASRAANALSGNEDIADTADAQGSPNET